MGVDSQRLAVYLLAPARVASGQGLGFNEPAKASPSVGRTSVVRDRTQGVDPLGVIQGKKSHERAKRASLGRRHETDRDRTQGVDPLGVIQGKKSHERAKRASVSLSSIPVACGLSSPRSETAAVECIGIGQARRPGTRLTDSRRSIRAK